MKRLGKIAVCLAGGLALNAGLRAANSVPPASTVSINNPVSTNNPSSDNPYATVAVRNIFGLIPPAPPENPTNELEKQLPKITPTGIMGVFGNWQVLFKVALPAKAGPPAKDEFYILSQGQRQDDIEVIKIDEKKSLVTFNNHGTTQELPLANAPASGGAPAASHPSPGRMNPGMAPGLPGGGGNGGPGGFTQFGAEPGGSNGGSNGGMANGTGGNGANGGLNIGTPPTANNNYVASQFQDTTPPDARIILMEAQRAQWQQGGKLSPAIIPPTPLTEFNTPDGGSGPAAP